jgi:hypothetical protein
MRKQMEEDGTEAAILKIVESDLDDDEKAEILASMISNKENAVQSSTSNKPDSKIAEASCNDCYECDECDCEDCNGTIEDVVAAVLPKGRSLNKPFRTPGKKKKFAVYTKNEKGNIIIVRFGDPDMDIKRDDPARRKNFRARHGCDKPGVKKWTPKYWSCRMWAKGQSVTDLT